MLKGTGKCYSVKEWFANKVANEVKSNIAFCDVFAILKETEKAVYAILKLGCNFHKTMWIPKSALVEEEVGENDWGAMRYETWRADTYEEALKEYRAFWSMFI